MAKRAKAGRFVCVLSGTSATNRDFNRIRGNCETMKNKEKEIGTKKTGKEKHYVRTGRH